MSEEIMKISQQNDNLVIEIPLDWLVTTQITRSDIPYKITNKDMMTEWISKNFMYWVKSSNANYSAWLDFCDTMFDNAYESGESWLEGIYFEELD